MQIAQQILFILISGLAIWLFAKKVKEISRNIKLGRDEDINDNKPVNAGKMFCCWHSAKRKCFAIRW